MSEWVLLGLQDGCLWRKELDRFRGGCLDIHFRPEYGKLFSGTGDVCLFVYREGECRIVYPFLLRKVPHPAGMSGKFGKEYYDITSFYGYGGPIGTLEAGDTVWNNFYHCFEEYCRNNDIITEFIRFHPLLGNHRFLVGQVEVDRSSSVVFVDLRVSEENIWSGYERNNRKNIKKAYREGLKVILEEAPGHFRDFLEIYQHTLSRNGARPFYYFPPDFYEAIHSDMAGNYLYAHAVDGGKVISTELLLYNDTYIHSFLGGTLESYYELRPNNILKHEVIKWAKERGIHFFMIGGGYQEGDGIFRYKRSFAKGGILDFYIGKKVHNPVAVRMVEEMLVTQTPRESEHYFPSYRRY